MPLTPAERSRRYRERKKENESTYTEYLRKERERYKKRKEAGKVTLIADMNPRDQRKTRRQWRSRKRKERDDKRKSDTCIQFDTPPLPHAVHFLSGWQILVTKEKEEIAPRHTEN